MNEQQIPSLPSVIQLFKQGWQRFVRNLKTLLLLEIISWIPFGILFAITAVSTPSETGSVGGQLYVISVLPILVLLIRAVVSVGEIGVLAADHSMSLSQALRHGSKRILPVIGNGILISLISLPLILAGAGMTLFGIGSLAGINIPQLGDNVGQLTLYFFVAFLILLPITFFYVIRLVFVTTLAAIGETPHPFRESWEMTRGTFWAVTWRLFVASALVGIVSSGIGSLEPTSQGIGSILGLIIQFILVLYSVAYTVSLLRALQGVKQQ